MKAWQGADAEIHESQEEEEEEEEEMEGGSDRSAENKTERFLLYVFIIDFLEYLIRFGQSLHPTVK